MIMYMKKADILFLENLGIQFITNHELSPKQAIKVVKFRKAFSSELKAINEERADILKDVGIENGQEFDAELERLRKSNEDPEKLQKMEAQFKRYLDLFNEMLNEPVQLNCVPLPYEDWHRLQNENRDKELNGNQVDILSGYAEDILENVLWEMPED